MNIERMITGILWHDDDADDDDAKKDQSRSPNWSLK